MIAQRDLDGRQAPRAKFRWRLAPAASAALRAGLPDLPPALLGALAIAGIERPEEATGFLARDPGDDNPFRMAGMTRAVERLRLAIREGEPVAVYGDYDADGVTATALLSDCLEALGADLRNFIPHRERDGYGLHATALDRLAAEGVRLLVTVDCGIRASDEIRHARSLGMDVIVTDHHALPEDLPEAVAVINPRRLDCEYEDRNLAGVGLAFKLAQALLRAAEATGDAPALREQALLDLVAIGTVADVVPLVGENRSLVHRGLAELRRARRPGLAAMLRTMGLDPAGLDASSIGYGIGPRLNAAGRMGDARLALDLLRAPDGASATALAQRLEALNGSRREATRLAVDAATARIESADAGASFLFDAAEDLPLGVVGLVAGRLCERYYRPAAVLKIEGDRARGSARSIPEFDMIAALDAHADLLQKHGGHARAAGFTMATADIPRLGAALRRMADRQLASADLRPVLDIAAEIGPEALSWDFQAAQETFGPFGEANRKPVLVWRNAPVGHARQVGSDASHLKLVLEGGAGRGSIDAIAFGRGGDLDALGAQVDLAFELEVNEWRGRRSLQLMVRDLAAPEIPARA